MYIIYIYVQVRRHGVEENLYVYMYVCMYVCMYIYIGAATWI